MKTLTSISRILAVMIAALLLAAACGSDSGVNTTAGSEGGGGAGAGGAGGSGAGGERIETLWVGPQLVDCVGVLPQKCLQVRYSEDGQVEWFYDSIEGFTHVAGTSYVLEVGVSDVADAPADGSTLRYRLIEVIESSTESVESVIADLDGTAWTLLGFRDGDLFDRVPDGIDVTATFQDGSIGGTSGCNSYNGAFAASEGGDAAVTVGPVMSTMMACEPDRMDIEARYTSILESVTSVEITFDDRLILSPTSGPALLFARA